MTDLIIYGLIGLLSFWLFYQAFKKGLEEPVNETIILSPGTYEIGLKPEDEFVWYDQMRDEILIFTLVEHQSFIWTGDDCFVYLGEL